MKYFIYRNTTVEHLFDSKNCTYSGYDDISATAEEYDRFIWFYFPPIINDNNKTIKIIDSYYSNLELIYSNTPKDKTLIVFTLTNLFIINPQSSDFSILIAINNFNSSIINFALNKPNIKIFDLNDFATRYPIDKLIDWKYFYLSNMVLNPAIAQNFKNWFNKKIEEINLVRKKCLVLDLDNTLWGGVLGEDGINGIKIGGPYPGNSFQSFQETILNLGKNGIILAICSKNNESDVLELWEKNPHLILRKEHFAAYKINWNNKADNLIHLSEELNIGLDSFVFIDDSPSERELVKSTLPSVVVPDFPVQPYNLAPFIKEVVDNYFVSYSITDEDRNKTEQYIANSKRNEEIEKFSSFDEYLINLQIEITIEGANEFNISRIAQMTQKTNQFNLTTKRYSDSDIHSLIKNGSSVYCLTVKDKFGDNGITGCAIINYDCSSSKKSANIDTFLLSCRILGKGIEHVFLISILKTLQKLNIDQVYSCYIPTQKNIQVSDFYEKNLFSLLNLNENVKTYHIGKEKIDELKINTKIYKIYNK